MVRAAVKPDSPLYSDLSGLPPLLLQVGGAERLLDENVELARRARERGVDVRLEILPGMPHIAQVLATWSEAGRRAIERAAVFFRERCSGDSSV